MSDQFDVFNELIANPIVIFQPTRTAPSRSVVLEEWDIIKDPVYQKVLEIRKVSSVIIKDLPEEVLVFKADSFPQPQALFSAKYAYARKRADFILFANNSGKKRIVFIEMKRTKDSENGIIAQLKGAACVMDYCKAVSNRFLGISKCFNGAEERFVSLSNTIGKRATYPDRNAPLHDTPDCLLKLKGHSFTYHELIRR